MIWVSNDGCYYFVLHKLCNQEIVLTRIFHSDTGMLNGCWNNTGQISGVFTFTKILHQVYIQQLASEVTLTTVTLISHILYICTIYFRLLVNDLRMAHKSVNTLPHTPDSLRFQDNFIIEPMNSDVQFWCLVKSWPGSCPRFSGSSLIGSHSHDFVTVRV